MGVELDLSDRLLSRSAWLTRWATLHTRSELPAASARTLALVEDLGPVRVTALAGAAELRQPSMSNSVQQLVNAGLVARQADPSDARASLVAITAEGAAALREVREARAAALAALLSDHPIDAADLVTTVRVLERIAEAAGAKVPALE